MPIDNSILIDFLFGNLLYGDDAALVFLKDLYQPKEDTARPTVHTKIIRQNHTEWLVADKGLAA